MSKTKECKEYNTLKYKTMITTGQNIDSPVKNETNVDILNDFLDQEMNENKKQSWNKLSKTDKLIKINEYIQTILIEKYALTLEERQNVYKYMLTLLDRKKLSKNSELDYDENTGMINQINIITFNQQTRKFTLNKDFKTTSKKKQPVPKSKTAKKVKGEINKIENGIK